MVINLSSIYPENNIKIERIYQLYKKQMLYVANSILHDEYLSEDAVHQAFIRIIDNLSKIEEVESHKTRSFVVIIVENIAIDLYRKRKRKAVLSLNEFEYQIADETQTSSFYGIEQAIMALPLEYRNVLRLKYSLGYHNREIAEILEIRESNVRKRLSRARTMLEEILRKGGISFE